MMSAVVSRPRPLTSLTTSTWRTIGKSSTYLEALLRIQTFLMGVQTILMGIRIILDYY
jgi:hypothetical protein